MSVFERIRAWTGSLFDGEDAAAGSDEDTTEAGATPSSSVSTGRPNLATAESHAEFPDDDRHEERERRGGDSS